MRKYKEDPISVRGNLLLFNRIIFIALMTQFKSARNVNTKKDKEERVKRQKVILKKSTKNYFERDTKRCLITNERGT